MLHSIVYYNSFSFECSRTFSALAQNLGELKGTGYNPTPFQPFRPLPPRIITSFALCYTQLTFPKRPHGRRGFARRTGTGIVGRSDFKTVKVTGLQSPHNHLAVGTRQRLGMRLPGSLRLLQSENEISDGLIPTSSDGPPYLYRTPCYIRVRDRKNDRSLGFFWKTEMFWNSNDTDDWRFWSLDKGNLSFMQSNYNSKPKQN